MIDSQIEGYEAAKEIAQIKFMYIAPVVSGIFTQSSQKEYFKFASQKQAEWPDGTTRQFSWWTIQGWLYEYKKNGIEGLMPKIRDDSGGCRKLDEVQIEFIRNQLKEFPKITAVMIYERMIREGLLLKEDISVDTLQRFIKRNGLRDKVSEKTKKEKRGWEFAHSCEGYEADTCHTAYIYDENGELRKTYLIAIIDVHSRMIVGAEYFFNDNAVNFQKVWKSAVKRYGKSSTLILDNGSSFKNKSTQYIAGKLGTHLIYNPPYSPTGKAVIERFFLSYKFRKANGEHGYDYHSLEEFNAELKKWIGEYNRTDHSSLKDDEFCNHTPLERYLFDMKDIEPYMLANKTVEEYEEWVEECFLREETRKVNGDSTVVIENVAYDVPSIYIGTRVIVRYVPETHTTIYIYDPIEDKRIDIKKTDRIENSKMKRTEIIY